jgi:acyl carrier protein
MSGNEASNVQVRIAALVGALLMKRGLASEVEADRPLRDAGLTSLDMVNLMLAVEGEFDLFIPQDKMTPAHFRSVQSIEALVTDLVRAP